MYKLPDSIPHYMNCPSCLPGGLNWDNQLAKLEWQKQSTRFYLAYYCNACKNGWTTTESDEISFKYHEIKERSLTRINKIKKVYELSKAL
jgi:hypothetical protein